MKTNSFIGFSLISIMCIGTVGTDQNKKHTTANKRLLPFQWCITCLYGANKPIFNLKNATLTPYFERNSLCVERGVSTTHGWIEMYRIILIICLLDEVEM